MPNILPGKKTILSALFFLISAIIEIGWMDLPWITDPWLQIQASVLFIFGRLGIKKVENAVKNGS